MDLGQKAKGAPYHLVTEVEECPMWRFWVVLLDNGVEVYQTLDDPSLDEPNSWVRLKQFCKDNDCKIVGMSFARQDLNPVAQINLTPQSDGYFYSKRVRKMMTANPHFANYTDEAQGFGELHGETLTIHWVDSANGRVTIEKRDLSKSKKHQMNLGLIR
tara:strand:+ start:354 stop:830 length:477 start_codon:yes stop_codon:yes gene_type:complete